MSERIPAFPCVKRSIALLVSIALLTVSGLVPVATAKRAPEAPAVEIIDGERQAEPSSARDGMRISTLTGAPLAIYGTGVVVDPGDPVTMARQYLGDQRHLLQLRHADLADLTHRFTRESPIGVTVHFDQQLDGVPVHGGEIAVSIDNARRVVFVANGYKTTATLASTEPQIAAGTARQTALAHLDVSGELTHDATRLVVFPQDGAWRLAYHVQLVPRLNPTGDWEIIVDAATGEILRAVDTACYVDGTGDVFDPDPLSSAGATYGDPGYVDGNDANTPELDAERVNVALLDIEFSGGLYTLKGPYAEIRDFEGPTYGLFQEASPSWPYNRFDNAFEAALCYFHVDHIMRWLNLDLGLGIMPFQYSGGVRFDPHGLNGADNSHYIGSTGTISFGEGGVDDSEDADVVIHELGHGLHDWVTGGSLSQVDGLSEGTGDYIAVSYSRSLGQWTPADPQYNWVFSWDGHNPFWNGRVTNYGAGYPGGLVGQIHTDGQIWATCLMRIWDAIGRAKTDQSCFAGLGMTNSGSSQNDAANAMLQAAIGFGYSPAELSAMITEFQTTGYTVGAPPEIEVSPLSFDFVLQPDAQGQDQLTIQNLTDPTFGATLDWTVSDFEGNPFTHGEPTVQARRTAGDRPRVASSKSNPDRRTGPATVADFGGPDEFGYVWIDSDDPGGPVFDWHDITGTGTPITLTDDGSISVALPFSFPFYGGNHGTVLISANGYLTFGTTGGTYENTGIPDASQPNSLVAGFWDDLNPTLGGTIHHGYDAGLDAFIVQWTNIQHYGGSAPYTFQIILFSTGQLLYQYQAMAGAVNSATIGIENSAASTGLEVVFNGPYVHDGLATLFTGLGECIWLSVNPTSGSTPPQGSTLVDVTADATGLSTGTYYCDLVVASNDPDESSTTIPVSLEVTGSSAVGEAASAPVSFRLHGNRPNPFNPMTTIQYELPTATRVRLAIYDESGRLVRVLVDGNSQDAGAHTVQWNGRDSAGKEMASGIYFYRLEAGTDSETRRAVMVR